MQVSIDLRLYVFVQVSDFGVEHATEYRLRYDALILASDSDMENFSKLFT